MPQYVEKSASRYILVTLAVVLFVTAMVLVILQNTSFKGTGLKVLKTYSDGYVDGFNRARDLAYQSGMKPLTSRPILSGTVTEVGADSLTFTAAGLLLDERVDGVGLTRAVYTTKDTVIVLMTLRPAEVFQQMQENFINETSTQAPGGRPSTLPSPYTEQAIKISDIKIGDSITSVSVNNEDVTDSPSFYASRIEVRRVQP